MSIEVTAEQSPSKTGALPPALRPLLMALIGVFVLAALGYAVLVRGTDPLTTATIFTTRFLGIFIEAVPFLLMGTLLSGVIDVFVRPDDIARWVPRNPILATVTGSFLGLIFPVCECGVVPVTRRLFTKGLPISVGIAFLLAAPFMNPIVFASTYIAFGFGTIFIGRFLITAIIAISVGLIFAFTQLPEDVLRPESMTDMEMKNQPRPKLMPGLGQALGVAGGEFFEMGRYLVMGCLLAAGMQTFIAQEALLAVGEGPVISVLVMQAFAFILSVCSTVDSFLALAFVSTFTTGAILAFLSFGPMVDIKSTMMFLGVFKRRTVAYLILLPFLMNLVAGTLVNMILDVV